MPISSEFVTLCRAQIELLTQTLGASISVVYLTKDFVEGAQTQLVPIAAYPENVLERDRQPSPLLLPASLPTSGSTGQWEEITPNTTHEIEQTAELAPPSTTDGSSKALAVGGALTDQRQLVLPLVHENGVFGLLVTRRDDRAWEEWEQAQVEEIARTLALACMLDQRYQWRQQQREQERRLQQQRDLLDNLLHQFRNSLTALQTFGKLILRRLLPGDRNHELATSLTRETERLRELAQQMEMALAAGLEDGRSLPSALPDALNEQLGEATLDLTPNPSLPSVGLLPSAALTIERCLVETVLEPLLTSAGAIAQEKGLTIKANLGQDLPPVWANPQALREVLSNLLENAIKYTPAGGVIWVEAEAPEAAAYLKISVTDTGVGIPAQDLPHIFERHYRGAQATGDIPGSGLGLAIARSLLEQMHGKIQVFSPALSDQLNQPGSWTPPPQSGTTFVIQLPIAIEDVL